MAFGRSVPAGRPPGTECRQLRHPRGEDLLHLFETFGVSFHFTPDMVVTRRRFGRDDLVDEFLQALYAADGEVFNELSSSAADR